MLALGACTHETIATHAPIAHAASLLTSNPSTWVKTGASPSLYTWSADPNVLDGGNATMRFERTGAGTASWAATRMHVEAAGYIGKRIRLTANVKTENAPDGAWLWLRIDFGSNQHVLCNMQNPTDHRLKGTNAFTPVTCVFDVPPAASNIVFGIGLTGAGRAWVGTATIDEVDRATPETDHNVFQAHPDAAAGWVMSGDGHEAYATTQDATTTRDNHATLMLAPTGDTQGRYGTWMRSIDAAAYRGKRVRISAFTKTSGTTKRADFWARVQGADSPGDGAGLGAQSIALGESDWTLRTIVLDVDESGAQIQYGIGIAGPGKAWIDEPKIEVVGDDVPVTNGFVGERTDGDWLMTGVGAPDYTLTREGDALRIEAAATQRYVALVRVVPAAAFVGKKARATLDVRTSNLAGEFGCVMKVQRVRQLQYAGFLALDMKKIPATTSGFVPCDLAVDVPEGAKWILFGFSYAGPGKAWVRGGSIH